MRREIYDIIEELKREKKTIVLTTHYIEEAERLCDRVAIVDHGKVIARRHAAGIEATSANTTRVEVRLASRLRMDAEESGWRGAMRANWMARMCCIASGRRRPSWRW